jgi:Rrf2 family protein
MNLTVRSEYALLALLYLARCKEETFIPSEVIAQAQQIPPNYLEQILLALTRSKYLRSSKGAHGGYRLAKPAEKISLAAIIRLFDGALAPTESVSENFYEPTPIEKETGLMQVFKEIRDYISDKLESTSLAKIAQES